MENMFSISFRKFWDEKAENNLFTLIIKMLILFARAIITSTARASSVFLSSYRNTVLNQSTGVFSFGYFLIKQHSRVFQLIVARGNLMFLKQMFAREMKLRGQI